MSNAKSDPNVNTNNNPNRNHDATHNPNPDLNHSSFVLLRPASSTGHVFPTLTVNPTTKTKKQTDQIIAELTAVELNSGYGVYEADMIIRSFPDKPAIGWSNYDMC